jgi:hypothetical protein
MSPRRMETSSGSGAAVRLGPFIGQRQGPVKIEHLLVSLGWPEVWARKDVCGYHFRVHDRDLCAADALDSLLTVVCHRPASRKLVEWTEVRSEWGPQGALFNWSTPISIYVSSVGLGLTACGIGMVIYSWTCRPPKGNSSERHSMRMFVDDGGGDTEPCWRSAAPVRDVMASGHPCIPPPPLSLTYYRRDRLYITWSSFPFSSSWKKVRPVNRF